MKKRLIPTAVGLLLGVEFVQGATITAPPPCASLPTLQSLLTSLACTVGDFTIKDPSFTGPAGVSASSITLSVLSGIDSVAVVFGGGVFNSPIGGSASFTFGYTIDPPPEIIKGVSSEIEDAGQNSFGAQSFEPSAAGDAISVQYLLCAGAAFIGNLCPDEPAGFTLSLPDATGGRAVLAAILAGSATFSSPVNTVGVQILVTLSNGGSFGSINSAFPLDVNVPEPGSLALFALGAAALAARRRGAARNQ